MDTHEIEVLRSDADPTTWPEAPQDVLKASSQAQWATALLRREREWKRELARLILQEHGEDHIRARLDSFPLNYKLCWRRVEADGEDSEAGDGDDTEDENESISPDGGLFLRKCPIDCALYGHPTGAAYKTPAAFYPHLKWLISDRQMKRKRCQCMYCPTLVTLLRRDEEKKVRKQEPECSFLNARNIQDICDVARKYGHFRTGELVWAVVTIDETGGRTGYVVKPGLKRKTLGAAPSEVCIWWPALVTRRSARIADQKALQAEGTKTSVRNRFSYHVKFLSLAGEHQVKSAQIMPWLAYDPEYLLHASGLRQAACQTKLTEALDLRRTLKELVVTSRTITTDTAFHKTYFSAIGSAVRRAREFAPFDRYSDPHDIRSQIGSTLHSNDSLRDSGDSAPGPEALCHFQGIWIGAEKIWLGDIVRIRAPKVEACDSNEVSPQLFKLLNIDRIWTTPEGKIRLSGIVFRLAKSTDDPALISKDPALFPSESASADLAPSSNRKGPDPANPSKHLGWIEVRRAPEQQDHFSLSCILGRWYPAHAFLGVIGIPTVAKRLLSADYMQSQKAVKWSNTDRRESYLNAIEPLLKGPKNAEQH